MDESVGRPVSFCVDKARKGYEILLFVYGIVLISRQYVNMDRMRVEVILLKTVLFF